MIRPDLDGITTRGQLLRRADEAIASAERSLMSARRALPVLVWSIGLMIMLFVEGGADLDTGDSSFALFPGLAVLWWLVATIVPGKAWIGHVVAFVVIVVVGAVLTPIVEDLRGTQARTFFLSVWAAVAVGAAWATWSYVMTSRRLTAQVAGWRDARRDPDLRTLDQSDVPAELATIRDLRDRPDFDEAVGPVLGRHQGRLFDLRTLKPTFVLMITGIMGLVFLLGLLVGLTDSRYAPAVAVCSLILLAPWAWAALVDMNQTILGRQVEANQVLIEARLYSVQRHLALGTPAAPYRRFSLLSSPFGLVLAVGWIAILVARVRSTSALVLVITLLILVVGTALFVGRMIQLGRQVRVFPLDGSGDSVLQSPPREVTLELTTDALRISDTKGVATPVEILLSEIVAIEPLTDISALSRRGVGIVTTGDPIVLAGRTLEDDPAIATLRQQLTPTR